MTKSFKLKYKKENQILYINKNCNVKSWYRRVLRVKQQNSIQSKCIAEVRDLQTDGFASLVNFCSARTAAELSV